MIFPKDRALYENLKTSFTHFPALLAYLTGEEFTGYVQIDLDRCDGAVFLDDGRVLNAVEHTGAETTTGATALRGLEAHAAERDGVIGVYTLSSSITRTLAAVVDSETLYRDLSSSFTSLDRLIAKLQSERHTGYIEVATAAGQPLGFIFFHEGDAIESVFCSEGGILSGPAMMAPVVEAASSMEATFHVYRAAPPASAAQTVAPTVSSASIPPEPAALEEPTAAPEPEPELEPAAVMHEPPPPPSGLDLMRVAEVWQETIARVEMVIDRVSGRDTFAQAFRRSLVSQATRFPFLDPFAAEFEYRNGTVTLNAAPAPDFNLGLGTCLHETIESVRNQLRRSDLDTMIRAALVETVARHAVDIERFELRQTLAEYLS